MAKTDNLESKFKKLYIAWEQANRLLKKAQRQVQLKEIAYRTVSRQNQELIQEVERLRNVIIRLERERL